MKKIILFFIFALITMIVCNAQKIEFKKKFGGYEIYQEGVSLTLNDLVILFREVPYPQASFLIKRARLYCGINSIITLISGGLIGYPIGLAVSGVNPNPNWLYVGIGAGLVLISVPISISFTKNAKDAVKLHNHFFLNEPYDAFKPKFAIIGNAKGIGFSMNF